MPVRALGRLWLIAAALVVAAGGLNGCGTVTTVAAGPPHEAQQFDVHLDAPSSSATPAVFPAYFPSRIVAHPGDRIVFHASAQGQPHTVTFGTAVDTALAPLDHAALVAGTSAEAERGALAAFPRLVSGTQVSQTLARPCALPASLHDTCTAPDQAFTGQEALFGSGVLANGAEFTVTLDPTIRTGTYRFFCAVMRSAMTGGITVIDPASPTPSPADVEREAQATMQTRSDLLAASAPHPANAHVVGGISVPGVGFATVFAPRHVHIRVGAAVTWTLTGATVSFDVPETLWLAQFQTRPDGTVYLNRAPITAIGSASWDGSSPRSSGAPATTFPPATSTYTLRFLTAGTYAYQCLLHADMSGVVTVG